MVTYSQKRDSTLINGLINGDVTKVKLVEKNCPLIKFVGLLGVSCLGHKRPKMLKNLEWSTFRVDTVLGQCAQD